MDVDDSISRFKNDPALRRKVIEYSKINTRKQLLALLFDWAVIAGAIGSALITRNPWIYLASLVVIASKQHALLVMMHEGAHFRITKNAAINDLISDFFAAYPLLFATRVYRHHHSAHHKYVNTDKDPDWDRKIHSPEWVFPKTLSQIAMIMFKQCLTAPMDWLIISYKVTKTDGWKKPAYWVVLSLMITYFKIWPEFAAFWLVPMFTIFPVIQRVRSISEHFGLARIHELNNSRNVTGPSWEHFVFSPHNANYHLLHHMFPSIPQHNLKTFDQELMSFPVYRTFSHRNNSFFFGKNAVLRDLSTNFTTENEKNKVA